MSELAPYFVDRDQAMSSLGPKTRDQLQAAMTGSENPQDMADKWFVSAWLAENSGKRQKDILSNYELEKQNFFGEGSTDSEAYDSLVTYFAQNNVPKGTQNDFIDGAKTLLGGAVETGLSSAEGILGQVAVGIQIADPRNVTGQERKEQLAIIERMWKLSGGRAFFSQPIALKNPERDLVTFSKMSPEDQKEFKQLNTRLSRINEGIRRKVSVAASDSIFTEWSKDVRKQKEAFRKWNKIDQDFRESIVGEVTYAIGQMGFYIPASMVPYLGPMAIESSIYQEAVDDYRASGGTDPQEELRIGLMNAIPGMFLERFGLGVITKKLFKSVAKGGKLTAKEIAKRAAIQFPEAGLAEGITEAMQGFLQDFIASETFDKDRDPLSPESFQQRFREFVIGALAGGGAGTVFGASQDVLKSKGRSTITSKTGDPLTKQEYAQARKLMTDDQARKQLGGTAELFIDAMNGNKEAQKVYNETALQSDLDKKTQALSDEGVPLSISDVKAHIDKNTIGSVNFREITKELQKAGDTFEIKEISPDDLVIQDEDLVQNDLAEFEGLPQSDIPIVVGKDGFVIDGRHRVLRAKQEGTKIKAIVAVSQPTDPKPLPKGIKAVSDEDLAKFVSGEDTTLTTPLAEAFGDIGFAPGEATPSNVVEVEGKIEVNGKSFDPVPSKETTDIERALFKKELELETEQFKTELNEDKTFTQSERDYFAELLEDQVFIELDEYGFERVKDRDLGPLKKKAKESRKGKLNDAEVRKRIKDAVSKAKLQGEIAVIKERVRAEGLKFSEVEKAANLAEKNKQAIKEFQFRISTKIKDLKKGFKDSVEKLKEDIRYKTATDKKKFLDERADSKEAIKQLREIISKLPPDARKAFPSSMFSSLVQAGTVDQRIKLLNKATNKIKEITEKYNKPIHRANLDSTIKAGLKRKKKAVEFNVFGEINVIARTDRKSIDEQIAIIDAMTEVNYADRLKRFMLDTFGATLNSGDFKGISSRQMKKASDEAKFIFSESKSSFEEFDAERVAENKRVLDGSIDEMILDGELLSDIEQNHGLATLVSTMWGKFKNHMRKVRELLVDSLDGMEMILDNLAAKGARFDTFMHKEIFSPAFEANLEKFTAVTTSLSDIQFAMIQLFGGEKSFLKKSGEWNISQDSGIRFRTDGGKVKNQPLTVWEAIEVWMRLEESGNTLTLLKMLGANPPPMRSLFESEEFNRLLKEWKLESEKALADLKSQTKAYIGNEGIEVARIFQEYYENNKKEFIENVERIDHRTPGVVDNYAGYLQRKLANDEQEVALGNMDPGVYSRAVATNGSLISRVGSTREIVFNNAFESLIQNMVQMNHYYAYGAWANKVRTLLKNPDFKRAVRQRSGGNIAYKLLNRQIDIVIRDGIKQDVFDGILNKMISNIAASNIILNVRSAPKQVGSIFAYLDSMPVNEWLNRFVDLNLNRARFSERMKLLKNTQFLKERKAVGMDREMRFFAKRTSEQALFDKRTLPDKGIFMTKYFDSAAIRWGGWPLYSYTYDNQMNEHGDHERAQKEAFRVWAETSSRTQQDGTPLSWGWFQSTGPFGKMLTTYLTAIIQYQRISNNAIRAAYAKRITAAQAAKTVAIFRILLPQVFQAMGSGIVALFEDREDEWENFKKLQLRALLLGNLQSVIFVGTVAAKLSNTVWNLPYGDVQTVLMDTLNEIGGGIGQMMTADDNEDFQKGLDRSLEGISAFWAVPYGQVEDLITGVFGEDEPDTNNKKEGL